MFDFTEPAVPEGWQSGLLAADGRRKPAYDAFRFPLVQTSRRGALAGLWGQVRPRSGRQPYRLLAERRGREAWLGGTRWTDVHGFLAAQVVAPPGARVRLWSPRDRAFGPAVVLR